MQLEYTLPTLLYF